MSIKYQVPQEYYFRLHHVRPRFKNNLENVLFFISNEIASMGVTRKRDFKVNFDSAIRAFPGNVSAHRKTIANWRTEIDALFGFVKYENGQAIPMRLASELAQDQDLVKFFKIFCYKFEYPNGGLKPQKVKEMLRANIKFRPAPYILNLLRHAEVSTQGRYGITKAEATHCIFNDLRVTRDDRAVEETFQLIEQNKNQSLEYDIAGDVIRYAGDFLDYMCQAQLLKRQPNKRYYLNTVEGLAIDRFCSSDSSFRGYEGINLDADRLEVKRSLAKAENDWIDYLNAPLGEGYFDTDILALFTNDNPERYEEILASLESNIEEALEEYQEMRIGDVGEGLVVNHEILSLIQADRRDLTHLVKLIPSHFAVGYDVSSREFDDSAKLIEVKTTASNRDLTFSRFHLTPNEWKTAESFGERYYIYRLSVTPNDIKLHVLQDPVGLYRSNLLCMSLENSGGVTITFDENTCGWSADLMIG